MQLSHAPRKMEGGNLKFQATSPAIFLKKENIEKLETSSGHGLQYFKWQRFCPHQYASPVAIEPLQNFWCLTPYSYMIYCRILTLRCLRSLWLWVGKWKSIGKLQIAGFFAEIRRGWTVTVCSEAVKYKDDKGLIWCGLTTRMGQRLHDWDSPCTVDRGKQGQRQPPQSTFVWPPLSPPPSITKLYMWIWLSSFAPAVHSQHASEQLCCTDAKWRLT